MADYDWADLMYGGGGSEYYDPYQDPYVAYGGQDQYYDDQGLIDMLNAAGGQDYFGGAVGAPTPEIGGGNKWSDWVNQFDPEALGYMRDDQGNWVAPTTSTSTGLWDQANELFASPAGKTLTQGLLGFAAAYLKGSPADQARAKQEMVKYVQNQGYNPDVVDAFLQNLDRYRQVVGGIPQPGLTPEAQQLWGQEAGRVMQTGITSEQEATRGLLNQALMGAGGWEEMYGKSQDLYNQIINQADAAAVQELQQKYGPMVGTTRQSGLALQQMIREDEARKLAARQAAAQNQQAFAGYPFQSASLAANIAQPYGGTYGIEKPLGTLQLPKAQQMADIGAITNLLFPGQLSTWGGLSQQPAGGTQRSTGAIGSENIWGPAVAEGLTKTLAGLSKPLTGGSYIIPPKTGGAA